VPEHTERTTDPERARVAELLEVAARLFRTNGYDATSMQDIADEMSILKGSLYHYVRSKEDLLWLIVEPSLAAIHDEVAVILLDRGEPLVGRIRLAIKAHVNRFDNDLHMYVIARETGSSLSPSRFAQYSKMRESYDRLWRDALREGVENGEVREDLDVRVVAHGILGMINWMSRWLPVQDSDSAEKGAEQFGRLVTEGIVAGSGRSTTST
jgi:AcrR family transcriptional regulator